MTMIEEFQKLYDSKEDKGFLEKKAWEYFSKIGLPTKKSEAFRYTSFKELYTSEWTLPNPLESIKVDQSALVFINGVFRKDLSCIPESVVTLTIREAHHFYKSLIVRKSEENFELEENPFVFLNQALTEEGVFLYLPPDRKIIQPLCFLFVQTQPKVISSPRIELFIGKNSQLTTQSNYFQQFSDSPQYWTNGTFHIYLEEKAQHFHLEDASGIKSGWGFQSVRSFLKKKSQFNSFSFFCGNSKFRQDLYANILGEEAEVDLKGLRLSSDKGQIHDHIFVQHQSPNSFSNQHFKTVVAQNARASFFGEIYVTQKAQQTDAYQLNNNLLLGEKSNAISQPSLEIFADDVKASHGATCSKPNKEELFYLRARGLNITEAIKQITKGFCLDFLEQIFIPNLRLQMEKRVERFLDQEKLDE